MCLRGVLDAALVFLSILPVGASLVAFPVGIVLLLTGNIWPGARRALRLYPRRLEHRYAAACPVVAAGSARQPDARAVSLFSGVKLFGFMGVIYGPAS